MKNLTYLVSCFLFINLCCCKPTEKLGSPSQDEEAQVLAAQLLKIVNLSNSETCTNPADWTFTAAGSKPCGGPWVYIAYSNNIDTAYFLNLIEQLRIAEIAYNEKWGVISDCSVPQEPSGVDCQNDLPVLLY